MGSVKLQSSCKGEAHGKPRRETKPFNICFAWCVYVEADNEETATAWKDRSGYRVYGIVYGIHKDFGMGEQKGQPNLYDRDRVTVSTVRCEDRKQGSSLLLLLRHGDRKWGTAVLKVSQRAARIAFDGKSRSRRRLTRGILARTGVSGKTHTTRMHSNGNDVQRYGLMRWLALW